MVETYFNLPSRKAANSMSLESLPIQQLPPPLKRCSYLSLRSLWHGPILYFYTAFLCLSTYFFSLWWAMVGHCLAWLLLSVLCHWLQFGLELEHICAAIKSRHCACTGEGHSPVRAAWGKRAASTRMIDTSQMLPLALMLWFCWSGSGGFLQIKLGPLGGPTDTESLQSWPVSYFTVRS